MAAGFRRKPEAKGGEAGSGWLATKKKNRPPSILPPPPPLGEAHSRPACQGYRATSLGPVLRRRPESKRLLPSAEWLASTRRSVKLTFGSSISPVRAGELSRTGRQWTTSYRPGNLVGRFIFPTVVAPSVQWFRQTSTVTTRVRSTKFRHSWLSSNRTG